MRLVLNQIGRRLTEALENERRRHRLLLMLDEFPALGRLDFFESQLAFMAGYGIRSFLIAQSLNQIERAYGPNNAILDNCHVRVAFATNDERTAKRVSDALGTATEIRDSRNYAGHRLSPWLGHLMVVAAGDGAAAADAGRGDAAAADRRDRPGVGLPADPRAEGALLRGPAASRTRGDRRRTRRRLTPCAPRPDDWSALKPVARETAPSAAGASDDADGGIRREPTLPEHEQIAPEPGPPPEKEFVFAEDEQDDDAARTRALAARMRVVCSPSRARPR